MKTIHGMINSEAFKQGIRDFNRGECKVCRDCVTGRLVWDGIEPSDLQNPGVWSSNYIAGWNKALAHDEEMWDRVAEQCLQIAS